MYTHKKQSIKYKSYYLLSLLSLLLGSPEPSKASNEVKEDWVVAEHVNYRPDSLRLYLLSSQGEVKEEIVNINPSRPPSSCLPIVNSGLTSTGLGLTLFLDLFGEDCPYKRTVQLIGKSLCFFGACGNMYFACSKK